MPRSYKEVDSYHIHVYFTEKNAAQARTLREWVSERFPVELGTWHDNPFGPHTVPSYYFGFETAHLPVILPWIILNRSDLSILLHPNTDSPFDDHTINAFWLGEAKEINTELLPHSLKALGKPLETINVNTTPSISEL